MSAYKEGATTIVRFDYDSAGRSSGRGFAAGATSTASYGFDAAGRLGSLTRGLAGTAADQSLGFAHNPASQIVTRTSSAANRLNPYTAAGPASFAYDANGNLFRPYRRPDAARHHDPNALKGTGRQRRIWQGGPSQPPGPAPARQ